MVVVVVVVGGGAVVADAVVNIDLVFVAVDNYSFFYYLIKYYIIKIS